MAAQNIEYQVVEVTKTDIRQHIAAVISLIDWSERTDIGDTFLNTYIQEAKIACQFFQDLLL